ncbi:uncharacterized protein NPIL_206271, partial [Nephila pilipes]
MNKISTEGAELEDGTVAARADLLVYVPICLATGGQVNVVHQQVLCALVEVLVEDVLLPPNVLYMLGGPRSEENSLAQSSQDLRGEPGVLNETEVSIEILLEKVPENVEDSQSNITSCRNEVGTTIIKDEEIPLRWIREAWWLIGFALSRRLCRFSIIGMGARQRGQKNYYKVDEYLLHRDKIHGESIGQLVVPECRRIDALRLAHTSVF